MKPGEIIKIFLLVPVLALFIQACAQGPVGWKKQEGEPGGTKEEWNRDRTACRYTSRREADNRLRQLGSEVGSAVYSTSRTLERDMVVLEAEKHERRLFESCLKARGYSKQ